MKNILIWILCGLPLMVAADVDIKKIVKQKWISFESEHFRIVANGKERRALAMLQDMEDFNYFLTELMGFEQDEHDDKLLIIAAKNNTTFDAMGMPDNIAGVFVRSQPPVMFANVKWFEKSDKGSSVGLQILLHELVHYLVRQSSADFATPPWFNEGIAEYFGSYKRKKNSVILGDLEILAWRFGWLASPNGRKYSGIDSADLFTTKQKDVGGVADPSEDREKYMAKFYARALAVVHYLNSDPTLRKKMYVYLNTLNKYEGAEKQVFEKVFGMSFADFDDKVEEYIGGSYVKARVFDMDKSGVAFPAVKTKPLNPSRCDTITEILSAISVLGSHFLGEETRDKLLDDIDNNLSSFLKPEDGCATENDKT